MALIKLGQGLYSSYQSLTKDQYQVYFTTDTKQIFVGSNEYTKGTKVMDSQPTDATEGNPGTLYAYNNSLYLCEGYNESESKWVWTRVANINDMGGSVTSVAAADGLETESGSAITSTGTIKHSVPSGATTVSDPTSDASAAFGSTFAIQGVATDKFGHVTASNTRTITMPEETVLNISPASNSETLAYGTTFAAITGVDKGAGSHDITATETVFTLPSSDDTTYTISSTTEGVVTLTPSIGNASTALIDGWNDLAKKSDITAVFKFKGVKATYAEVEAITDAVVGDVWSVTADNSEYVCTATGNPATWEKLGPVIDLSAYALSADVIQRVTGEDGEVPKFKADGTIESTGFTLGCSVPATAIFTDTTYAPATTAVDGLMSANDKAKLDGIESAAEVNIIEVVKVDGTALTVDSTDRSVNVTLSSLGVSSSATAIDNAVSAVEWDMF